MKPVIGYYSYTNRYGQCKEKITTPEFPILGILLGGIWGHKIGEQYNKAGIGMLAGGGVGAFTEKLTRKFLG